MNANGVLSDALLSLLHNLNIYDPIHMFSCEITMLMEQRIHIK